MSENKPNQNLKSSVNQVEKFKVLKVFDGDTIECLSLSNSKVFRIRLNSIDAPEINQPGGWQSKYELYKMLEENNFETFVVIKDIGKNSRFIADIYTDEYSAKIDDVQESLNYKLCNKGLAWSFMLDSSKTKSLYLSSESGARFNQRGIFNRKNEAIHPAEWRKEKSQQTISMKREEKSFKSKYVNSKGITLKDLSVFKAKNIVSNDRIENNNTNSEPKEIINNVFFKEEDKSREQKRIESLEAFLDGKSNSFKTKGNKINLDVGYDEFQSKSSSDTFDRISELLSIEEKLNDPVNRNRILNIINKKNHQILKREENKDINSKNSMDTTSIIENISNEVDPEQIFNPNDVFDLFEDEKNSLESENNNPEEFNEPNYNFDDFDFDKELNNNSFHEEKLDTEKRQDPQDKKTELNQETPPYFDDNFPELNQEAPPYFDDSFPDFNDEPDFNIDQEYDFNNLSKEKPKSSNKKGLNKNKI